MKTTILFPLETLAGRVGEESRIFDRLHGLVLCRVSWQRLAIRAHAHFFTALRLAFDTRADADDDHYGRLGVLCGWRTHARMAFDVPPQAFTPPPKVTSSVVHLEPVPNPLPCDVSSLERVTHAAFGQRRKMLRQSVKSLGGEALLARAEIDPQRRAETLSVEEFVRLANAL